MGVIHRLANKKALIVGGANGIGRATVELFCAEGAEVCIVDVDLQSGQSLAIEMSAKGFAASFLAGDASHPNEVKRFVDEAVRIMGRIDILFNHAGVIAAKPFLDYSIDEWDWLMNNNARSVFLVTREVLPSMIERGRGVIISTSSSSVKAVTKYESAYCASKAAMHELCRGIAVEYRDAGIRSNLICPSFVRTKHADEELKQLRRNGIFATESDINIMQGRICEPEEVASTALFLASDESSFINGAEIFVDNTFTAI